MAEVIGVSGYMAAWVADAAKQPAVVPPSIAARNARRMEIRQERGDASDDEIESATPVIQSTTIALDLMEQGSRQPQATVKHAIESYFEDQ